MIAVPDLVAAYPDVIKSNPHFTMSNGIFTLGPGIVINLQDLYKQTALSKTIINIIYLGCHKNKGDVLPTKIPTREGDISHNMANAAAMHIYLDHPAYRKKLCKIQIFKNSSIQVPGISPEITAPELLAELVKFFKTQTNIGQHEKFAPEILKNKFMYNSSLEITADYVRLQMAKDLITANIKWLTIAGTSYRVNAHYSPQEAQGLKIMFKKADSKKTITTTINNTTYASIKGSPHPDDNNNVATCLAYILQRFKDQILIYQSAKPNQK